MAYTKTKNIQKSIRTKVSGCSGLKVKKLLKKSVIKSVILPPRGRYVDIDKILLK